MAVYLDHNATTPMRPHVLEAMTQALKGVGNPSSVHGGGRLARAQIEQAREKLAAKLGVSSNWIYFTSGGTEANNLVLKGIEADTIIVSSIEHPAVLSVCENVNIIRVDHNGLIDMGHLRELLENASGKILVSVMMANNETGVLQPVSDIADMVHEFGGLFHTDAVQAFGKIDVDMRAIGADFLTLSAHKIGGPAGVGAMVKRPEHALSAQNLGGGQERSLRAGTENISGIVGFGAAVDEMFDYSTLTPLRDALVQQIKSLNEDVVVFGETEERLANTVCVALPGMPSERQVMAMDLAGFMISAGSACSSGKVKSSHVLKAMGIDEEIADCAIRISLGWDSQKEDVDAFVTAWSKLAERVSERTKTKSNAA